MTRKYYEINLINECMRGTFLTSLCDEYVSKVENPISTLICRRKEGR